MGLRSTIHCLAPCRMLVAKWGEYLLYEAPVAYHLGHFLLSLIISDSGCPPNGQQASLCTFI